MKLLAFETSTEACSIAVWDDGALLERFEIAPRRHAELALPWAEALLAEAGLRKSQLDAIAVGRGPGAFTGVRLAIALAQGIALALDRPVLPVSTLAAIAMQGQAGPDAPGRVLAAIDARMGEIYAAAFLRTADGVQALSHEYVAAPATVALPDDDAGWQGLGTGFGAAEGALLQALPGRWAHVDAAVLPHAADVARLAAAAFARGEAVAAEQLAPAYLRDNVALTLVEQHALREAKARG
ncbi:tRNA (adenosine(37)-N6)-threonylcarbamoyltransferase complex dimerization subunit type 1 TsaB [Luteimonas sp. RIT-PG2_3]